VAGKLGVAVGAVALLMTCGTARASTVRVLEAEAMKASGGAVVHTASAAGGKVLALRLRGRAVGSLGTPAVTSVFVRARRSRCRGHVSLRVAVAGRARTLRPGRRWHEHRIALTLPAGTHAVRVSFRRGGGRACRAVLDRITFTGAPAPAPPPAPPPSAHQPLRNVPLGASVIAAKLQTDLLYEAAFRQEFTSLTPENEMKMEWLQPERGQWNFEAADRLVAYAQSAGKDVRGHALVFGKQTPPWVGRLLLPDEAARALKEHITTVMQRYRGRVRTWDVVNEAFAADGTYRPNAWHDKLGNRYVELAFQYARAADPAARLVYNEFDAETGNAKRAAVVALVRKLRAKGLVDDVGLQLHTDVDKAPTKGQLLETMRLYESMGAGVEITEMDVLSKGDGKPETLAARLTRQADVFGVAATACAEVATCSRMTVWGVTDRYSWMGIDQLPLLLDAEFRPKPALAAVRQVIG
jgi:GH35 family endo-1,4-beta-xylanase